MSCLHLHLHIRKSFVLSSYFSPNFEPVHDFQQCMMQWVLYQIHRRGEGWLRVGQQQQCLDLAVRRRPDPPNPECWPLQSSGLCYVTIFSQQQETSIKTLKGRFLLLLALIVYRTLCWERSLSSLLLTFDNCSVAVDNSRYQRSSAVFLIPCSMLLREDITLQLDNQTAII